MASLGSWCSYYKIGGKSMGKRELLIVAAFVIIGAIAYQLTAPAPRAGARRFSLATLTDAWHRQTGGQQGRAELTTTGSIERPAATSELKVSGATNVVIVGEARSTVEWTLLVQARGQDDEAALRLATATTMRPDDLGAVLVLAVKVPAGARPAVTLTLRVPSRETVRVEGAIQSTISGIAGLRLEAASGDTTITGIAGPLTGAHRNGALTISGANAVTLSTVGSNLTLTGVRGETTLTVRNGSSRVVDSSGSVTIDATNATIATERSQGVVRLTGTNGTFTVINPRGEVQIDARNAGVTVALDAPAPVTVTTTGAATRLILDGKVPIELDAATEQGAIDATAIGLTPDVRDGDATLRHAFGDRARVTLRNTRGEIEIASRK
jgi:hypothetical protein